MAFTIIPRSFGTHDGSFHADEVTACALLLLFDLIDYDKIFRTRSIEKLGQCDYVCDVGGVYDRQTKRFDHHQADYKGDLSSAGMVLSYLRDKGIIDEQTYHYFNTSLVIGVDAIDNGKTTPPLGLCTFSSVISAFVPPRQDVNEEVYNQTFFSALDFALGHLKRLLEKFLYIQECRDLVREEMKEGGEVLIFDVSIPWIDSFFELGGQMHPALFVIMPTQGQWKLRGIPPSLDRRMEVRFPHPKEWAGLREEELEKVTGISGAVFCHKGQFISIWETKEAAFKAYQAIRRLG